MIGSLLRTDKVTYAYSRKGAKVLNEMEIDIPVGKKTAILGSNGAGKSTLFSVLNALYKPVGGKVLYKDKPLSYGHKDKIKMRSEVSILFQNPNEMMFKPYVEQDVAYGPENMKLPKSEVEERVQEALFAVGMEKYRKTPIMKLSYGQRKRVTLAGVLAMRPSVLIMDEPTAGLDPQMAFEVMEIAEQLNSSGVTVIMSSHDTDLVYSWADEIRVLNSAKCVYSGLPEPFYENYPLVQKAGLLLPSVYKMNRAFAGMGKCALEPYPRTQSQLSVKISDRCNTNYGTMNVVKVENDTDIAAVLESEGLTGLHTGICGMSARTARNKVDMPVDFMYNGPENCINKCLSGEDSVLLCDPQMVSKAIASADFINSNGFGKIDVKMI
jgi:cobalt/nickel transport system ATP-binding protein